VEHENSKRNDSVFSRKIRAGRRRTYFFDVRTTRGNDYYITITESKKRFDGNGYERHKLFIYKEDFNKFAEELQQVIDHIKGLLPDFDFDAFNHDTPYEGEEGQTVVSTNQEEVIADTAIVDEPAEPAVEVAAKPAEPITPDTSHHSEEVDKW